MFGKPRLVANLPIVTQLVVAVPDWSLLVPVTYELRETACKYVAPISDTILANM